jgi:hypothetical protein
MPKAQPVYFSLSDAGVLEHVGMDHPAAHDLDPSRVLADGTPSPATHAAADVHFCGRLREREVRGPEPCDGVGAKELAREVTESRLQVDETDAFIDCETFHLGERRKVRRVEGVVAIADAGTDDAVGWRPGHHRA